MEGQMGKKHCSRKNNFSGRKNNFYGRKNYYFSAGEMHACSCSRDSFNIVAPVRIKQYPRRQEMFRKKLFPIFLVKQYKKKQNS